MGKSLSCMAERACYRSKMASRSSIRCYSPEVSVDCMCSLYVIHGLNPLVLRAAPRQRWYARISRATNKKDGLMTMNMAFTATVCVHGDDDLMTKMTLNN